MNVDDLKDFAAIIVGTLFLTALVVGLLIGIGLIVDSVSCRSYGRVTGAQTQYAVGTCYVRIDRRWMSMKERLARQVTADRGVAQP